MKIAMKGEEPKGLLAIWADIEEDYRIEFEKWHNCEHVPERVNIPGFCVGHRYRGIGDAPEVLMFYETLDSKTLETELSKSMLKEPIRGDREFYWHDFTMYAPETD